jgi:hypothetical protein
MKTTHSLKASMVAVAFLMCAGSQAATMAKSEYKKQKEQIEATYKSEKATCGTQAGNAKDICMEEAKGREKVAKAELEYTNSGSQKDMNKVAEAKADAAYNVAKEQCDDKAGNDKDVCVKEAKAAHTKAKADAKLSKQVGEARKDAAVDKRDANYQVAAEKCDALSGEAKSSCVQNAKVQFGKN